MRIRIQIQIQMTPINVMMLVEWLDQIRRQDSDLIQVQLAWQRQRKADTSLRANQRALARRLRCDAMWCDVMRCGEIKATLSPSHEPFKRRHGSIGSWPARRERARSEPKPLSLHAGDNSAFKRRQICMTNIVADPFSVQAAHRDQRVCVQGRSQCGAWQSSET